MSLRPLGCSALAVAIAATVSAGEIRGRVLVDGKPDATVTVRALPFEDAAQEARREARREGLPAPLAETTARADGSFVLNVAASSPGASVRLAFAGPSVASRVLEQILDAAGDEVAGGSAGESGGARGPGRGRARRTRGGGHADALGRRSGISDKAASRARASSPRLVSCVEVPSIECGQRSARSRFAW